MCFSNCPRLPSCCHVGDAVSVQQRSADDHGLLPLHVYGVGASSSACLGLLQLLDVSPLVLLQRVWRLFCWQVVPNPEGSSMEERSLLCKWLK